MDGAVALQRVPLSAPDLREDEIAAVVEVLRSGWLACGPRNQEFEESFGKYLGVDHCVALNSCASALFLALHAQGVRGEVIVPSFTFAATANAVETAGARCVWADVTPDTGTLDPDAVEAAVTPRTEALIAVHFAGHTADMERLAQIARRHNLALIEDAAEALGAAQYGTRAGAWGTGCFSFFPTKNLCTGEGGMLTTRDHSLAARVRALSSHGIAKPLAGARSAPHWQREAIVAGFNLRMPHMAAALGGVQLRRLDAMNNARRAVAARYAELLDPAFFELPTERSGHRHVYQLYAVKTRGLDRRELLKRLWEQQIEASVHFDPPVHRQPFYTARYPGRHALPVTRRLAATVVSLPMFPRMTDAQVECVAAAANAAARASRRVRTHRLGAL